MKKNILIVGAIFAIAVVVAVPFSALVAGIMTWVLPQTFSFWGTFGYAMIACSTINVLQSWYGLHRYHCGMNKLRSYCN